MDWLIRAAQNRKLAEGDTLWERLAQAPIQGEVRFTLPARPKRPSRPVVLTVRVESVTVQPRGGKPVQVTALRAREESAPAGVKPLDWRLLTNRPVATLDQAAEWIQWYGTRWSIEVFFRIFKTGCRVEALQLSTLERLEPALALYLIIAWRLHYLTVLGRTLPELPGDAVLDPAEWRTVYVAIHRKPPPKTPPPLSILLAWIARLGGHLGRKCDGPPGPKALWIGLQRARDLAWGCSWLPSFMPQASRDMCNGQVAAGGSGGLIVYGGAKTAQMFNVLTGETCTLSITCRGFGLYIGESAGWTGELQVTSAWCGKGLAGWSFGLLGDLGVGCEILSGGVGGDSSGGEITGGSPVGCGAVAGAALYACETEVISCSNTPCECECE